MPRVSSPVFVGRAAELDRLCHALHDASTQRPATRLIAGEAGIGKTRLIAEFTPQAEAQGARVLVGDCLQLGETGLPYAPFVAALRPLLRSVPAADLDELIGPGRGELAHLLPDLGPPVRRARAADAAISSPPAQARLFEIILGLLRRLADEQPLVLVLEDLHWADSSTRDLLRFLLHNARDGRFMFVATYRSDELHRRHPLRPLLAELQRMEAVDIIDVHAFGADELSQQLAGITGSRPEPRLVEEMLARSGGNPFFAEELLAAGEARLAVPRTLRATLEDRVRQLSPHGQRVLRAAAVGGARIDHDLLADVVELDEPRLTAALREAVEHHLLRAAGPHETPSYAFRHALVQEVVYEELLPGERTQLHARFATAIGAHPHLAREDPPGTAAQLAQHWYLAYDLERALPAALDAGRAATAAYAFAEAEAFLERALGLWLKVRDEALPPDMDRVDLLEMAAEAAAQAGHGRRAISLVQAALAETDAAAQPARAGVLHHRLNWYLNESGDWEGGVVALERAVELIPIDPPAPERARVVSDLAHSLMVRGRYTESLAVAEAALAISRAVQGRIAEARALNVIGLDIAGRSDLERGIPMLREGHALALTGDDPQSVFLTAVGLGWALDETGRHEEALEIARVARERIHAIGAEVRFGPLLCSKMGRALWELGRWGEAQRVLDDTIAAGPSSYAMRWLLSNRIRLHVHRGDLELARRDLATYFALGEHVIGPDPDLVGSRRAELAIVAGQRSEARAIVAETLEQLAEPDVDTDGRALLLIGLRAEAEEADLARGSRDAARGAAATEVAAGLADRLRRQGARVHSLVAQPAAIIAADLALGEALLARVRGEPAGDLWESAVEARRPIGRPFELVDALANLAAARLAERRRDEATAAMTEAHPIAEDLGAAPLLRRIEALARRARIGLEGVDTVDDTVERLGLTAREREVLELLGTGRTNRQIGEELFMAESTAGVHVSNILGKLGVASRGEAAVMAHRLGIYREA
ncbi:MAG: helix-turn-helix transcriptional regulator [Candidatus Limnocylindria bacterium]